MDKAMMRAKEQALDLVDRLTRDGELSTNHVEALFYATGVVKNICKMEEMDGSSFGHSYGDGDTSGVRRNRRGQFSRNGSRSYGHDEIVERIGQLMQDADSEQRRALEECLRKLEE